MNKKIIAKAILLFFSLLLAITGGFGKLDLEHYNRNENESTRLTEKIRIFKETQYGFDVHCPPPTKRNPY